MRKAKIEPTNCESNHAKSHNSTSEIFQLFLYSRQHNRDLKTEAKPLDTHLGMRGLA